MLSTILPARPKQLLALLTTAAAPLMLAGTLSNAAAETLMMPDRDAFTGQPVVVWGVTTQPNGTAYTLDCGNGSNIAGAVADRSYIPFSCTYATEGIFGASLTVGAEVATVNVQVFDPTLQTAANKRGLDINLAIEDGLRWLWTQQLNRAANFPAGTTTHYGGTFAASWTSLVVLAFENHNYRLTNDNVAPTGLYEKYLVRRGLNYIFSVLQAQPIGVQPAGNPCVGPLPAGTECDGLRLNQDGVHSGYETPLGVLALAGSGSLNRTQSEIAGLTNGQSYGEILQRLSNTIAWGQAEDGVCGGGLGRGGWTYNLNNGPSFGGPGFSLCSGFDGSTVGWAALAMFDASAAGAVVPAFVATEAAIAVTNAVNTNGSIDYQGDNNPAGLSSVGIAKAGVGLQLNFLAGNSGPFTAIETYISDRWTGGPFGGDANWGCQVGGNYNTGCAYSMFNNFKGLKLVGTQTLPGVGRAAGPGAIPANDWHADYQDWLIANQAAAGNWPSMQFSCCAEGVGHTIGTAAVAELLLSPVALVLPDPDKFSAVGLSPPTAENPVGTSHTVTAHAESTSGSPVPGATVDFVVLTGPNAGQTGQAVTNASGDATFTYTDMGPATGGTDTIQASIGNLKSNIVQKTWVPPNEPPVCTDATAGPSVLWPPNHKLVPISINGVTDPDGDPLSIVVTSVRQDEPRTGGGQGAGNTAADATLSPLTVRSERNGNKKTPGDGRVYHIAFTATDPLGESCSAVVTVCVPHDQGNGNFCIDGGPLHSSIP